MAKYNLSHIPTELHPAFYTDLIMEIVAEWVPSQANQYGIMVADDYMYYDTETLRVKIADVIRKARRPRTMDSKGGLRMQNDPNKDEITCPFCGENDFDKVGLRLHLTRGHCEVFDNLNIVEVDDE